MTDEPTRDPATPAASGPDAWRPRSLEELTPEERERYERELDSGVTELPPNQIRGILGEKGPDIRKVESFEPNLNAGLSQEGDGPVQALVFLLAYVLFFPLAFFWLWRSRSYSRGFKTVASVVMAIGIAAVVALLMRG